MKKILSLFISLYFISSCMQAQKPRIIVHDPVMIKQDSTYYVFSTGKGITVWSSLDMQNWKNEGAVFNTSPTWAVETVKGFDGHIWAPDISYHNGQYYLYYSISAFGKNTSCIGLAINKTLNPNDPDFKWVDHGKVIQSFPNITNWNAIDPNLIFDEHGTPWFSFGSFWDGLQLVKLNQQLTGVAECEKPVTFASRKKDLNMDDAPTKDAGENAIEGPFIYKKGDYYYLFASIDYCCKGVESTYKMIIGRSKNVEGPYLDKEGKSMKTGGGSVLMAGDENWHGVGHNAVVGFDGIDYLVFHAYDASDNGLSKLRIFKLKWDKENWPYPAEEVY